jgi:hypothetical protein
MSPALLRCACIIPTLSILLMLSGCDEIQKANGQPVAAAAKKAAPARPLRRFEVMKFDAGVAFDSQTGQICKTWDWTVTASPKVDPVTGTRPQQTLGEFAPSCLSLYKEYPSSADASDPLGIRDEKTD